MPFCVYVLTCHRKPCLALIILILVNSVLVLVLGRFLGFSGLYLVAVPVATVVDLFVSMASCSADAASVSRLLRLDLCTYAVYSIFDV